MEQCGRIGQQLPIEYRVHLQGGYCASLSPASSLAVTSHRLGCLTPLILHIFINRYLFTAYLSSGHLSASSSFLQ